MTVRQQRSRRHQEFPIPRAMGDVDILDHDGFTTRLSVSSGSAGAKETAVRNFFTRFCSEYPDCDYRLVNVDEDYWMIQLIPQREPPPRNLTEVRF